MTIFSDNPYDRRMERLMMTIPNFAPRGVGFRFTEAQLFITATAATPSELLTTTMRQIRCPPFRKRFNEYIESEENPMTYINEKHRTRFTLAAKNVHRENYALLSALYLLTADQRLWSCCKHHINNGCVFFENIKLHNCTERAYTFYCAAKDLTLGTKHLTVSDLSDADLVPPMLFRTICNAMAIRRFGLAAMDNDTAGQAANKRISDKLFIQGIKHEILVPEFKDWNEDLLCDEQEEVECQTLQL